jgi:PAS domain S-box-containing protein
MPGEHNNEKSKRKIRELEAQLSEVNYKLNEAKSFLEEEQKQRKFYQLVADFTFGWEIWLDPDGNIKYCSPSCYDLTGFTTNQVIASPGLAELLVYELDLKKFKDFVDQALDQLLMNQSLEFRILTRHKQLRWCFMNVRGVYNKDGRYLGIRASIQDITKLKRAMGHIHDLSTGKEIENRAKLRIKSQLDSKERELVSYLLQLSQKNELITLLTKQLKSISEGKSKIGKQKLSELLETLEKVPEAPVDWELVVLQMENLHPGFLGKLMVKHPTLTPKEKKLCAYLRLGLSSKEISGLQNISSKSVEIARVRLRKKLKLTRQTRLSQYLEQI